MNSAGWEWQQAEQELQEELAAALDRCHEKGAKEDDLRLLAWQAGLTTWKPTKKEQHV
jgi:hypothetical protein